jgi:hypothetical protein
VKKVQGNTDAIFSLSTIGIGYVAFGTKLIKEQN